MAYGRYLEEFTVGEVIRHWPGRTISEADCTWFALLTMNQHPVHSDANYAEKHTQHKQHKQRLVLGPLVFSIGIGMTVADVSGRSPSGARRSCPRRTTGPSASGRSSIPFYARPRLAVPARMTQGG